MNKKLYMMFVLVFGPIQSTIPWCWAAEGFFRRQHPCVTYVLLVLIMNSPMLVLPGGGIFFWWQAGAITGLKKRFDLNDLHHPAGSVSFIGSSAGALASTLAVSGL